MSGLKVKFLRLRSKSDKEAVCRHFLEIGFSNSFTYLCSEVKFIIGLSSQTFRRLLAIGRCKHRSTSKDFFSRKVDSLVLPNPYDFEFR